MLSKNTTRKIATVIFGIVCFQNALSQENYQPGYIIKLSSDTLRGYIDYRNWERNPNKINFKNDLSKDITIYTPLEIKGFSVINEKYESAIVKTEVSPINTENLQLPDEKTTNKELVFETDTTFLQTTVQGERSLYYYCNRFSKDQFYIKQDTTYTLLIYKKYLKAVKVKSNDAIIISENKKYLGQLAIYLQKCNSIQSKLKSTRYNKESMKDIFLYYYKTTKSNILYQEKTEKTKIKFGVLLGVTTTKLKFKSDEFDYLTHTNYKQSTNFTTGVFFDIILRRSKEKWSIYNELTYTSYNVKGTYNNYTSPDQYTITNTTFKFAYIKINNMLRYTHPIKNSHIYINGGISNGLIITEKNHKKEVYKFFTTEKTKEDKAFSAIKNHELGIILGVGTKYKRCSFEVRYEVTNGMSSSQALNSSVKRYYALLGFMF